MKIKLTSIRWRFPITYAVIALITASVLGGTLLAVLRAYYGEQEQNYLQKNAISIAAAITPILSQDTQGLDANKESKLIADLRDHITLLAFLSQTRVRLTRMDGTILVDTGAPADQTAIRVAAVPARMDPLDPTTLDKVKQLTQDLPPGKAGVLTVQIITDGSKTITKVNQSDQSGRAQPSGDNMAFYYAGGQGSVESLPAKGSVSVEPVPAGLVSDVPVVGTMYGFELQKGSDSPVKLRSSQMFKQAIPSLDGKGPLGAILVSDGPAYGMDIVMGVARAWVIASLVAILIAALIGWWISRRMSAPILALTEATGRMAAGDLSVRAEPRSHDELGALGRSFNEMAGRVEEMILALRRFAGDAAHELRTPLTALHTSLELVRSDPNLAVSTRASLEQAWEETQRLEILSRDLLDLSRLESAQLPNPPVPVDLIELIRGVSEPFASQAEQAGILFSLENPEGALRVSGHPDQLCRGVSNLLENALKFTPSGGEVRVTLSQEGEQARLEISDTGIGIPIEDLPFVFNRFHRGRNVTAYPGSGLGLAIVKAVVERHAGEIEIECPPEGGTKFVMRLPLVGEET
jgi:signal transduction histidine kinase